ncbi:MAG: ribonuclease E/G [Deltaproteobacteria bacterium]|nr:ribonuclease E/G [Deltaproteobacteria bacterium]
MAKKKMLIDAARSDQVRVAVVENQKLVELEIESETTASLRGNIYKGVIKDIIYSLNAAFVDFGEERDGFLAIDDINPSIYPSGKSRRDGIKALLHRGQSIIVQVVKDAVGNKGCSLTSNLSLAGRYTVLMIGPGEGGISKKVDEEERKRLRKILDTLKIPDGVSVILRTAGATQTKAKLQRDINRLGKLLSGIRTRAKKRKSPGLLHRESDLVLRALRDYFDNETTEVFISSDEAFQRAEAYCRQVMPNLRRRLKLYEEQTPIFVKYQIEEQVSSLYERKVPLPSGGSLVIDPTEALVAVDVNSGKSFRSSDPQANSFKTNLEAAEELARQLRLRDLGGIIAVDFIDMASLKNRKAVERAVKEVLKKDRARIRVGRISEFGVLELTRQRLKKEGRSQTSRICPTCGGSGWIRSPSSAALDLLRKIRARAALGRLTQVRVTLHPELAEHLQNAERSALLELEREFGIQIVILFGPGMTRDQQEIEFIETGSEARGPTRGRTPAKAAHSKDKIQKDEHVEKPKPREDNGNSQRPRHSHKKGGRHLPRRKAPAKHPHAEKNKDTDI